MQELSLLNLIETWIALERRMSRGGLIVCCPVNVDSEENKHLTHYKFKVITLY